MPLYNRETTVKRAIDSVINQSYADWELIIVDDFSTDNSVSIIKSYDDSRIKLFLLEKNSGACIARNYGIKKSTGDFIAFLDSDDEWMPNKLGDDLINLERIKCDVLFSKYERFSALKKQSMILPYFNEYVAFKDVYFSMLKDGVAITSTIFGKSSVIKEIMFDESLPRLQEYDFCLRISQVYNVGFYNKINTKIYLQKDSITYQSQKLVVALRMIYEKNEKQIILKSDILKNWLYRIALAEFKNKNKDLEKYDKLYSVCKIKKIKYFKYLTKFKLNGLVLKIFQK